MFIAVSSGTIGVAVFALCILTLIAKVAGRESRALGVIRWILAAFYGVLVICGIAGLCFSGWLMFAGGGKAAVLLIVTVPLSLILLTTGSSLFRFITAPIDPAQAPRPLQNSSGWGALAEASEKMRNGGVAAHLRPEALVRRDSDQPAEAETRE